MSRAGTPPRPSRRCTRQAVAGTRVSGVAVATRMRSTPSTPARSRARRAAAAPITEAVWPAPARRRSRMPVRSRIQQSEVSTNCSSSALVISPSGTNPPTPSTPVPGPALRSVASNGSCAGSERGEGISNTSRRLGTGYVQCPARQGRVSAGGNAVIVPRLAAFASAFAIVSSGQPPLPEPNFAHPLVPSACTADAGNPYEAAQYREEGCSGPAYQRYPGGCQRLHFTFGPIVIRPGQNDVIIQPITVEKPAYDGDI